ncbi:DUF917 domain-containing protein [Sediminivirga luteola]|nr:DUF917 domain-containing protein [Sediminivirga luteola]
MLTIGARLFGCGGGGDAGIGRWLARRYLGERRLDVMDPLTATAHGQAVALGIAGAADGPLSEQLPSGAEFPAAVERLASLGVDAQAVVPLEVGGFNGLAAVAAAAQLSLPVLDADLSGRALPWLDQFSPAYSGVSMLPAVLVDAHGRTMVVGGATHAAAVPDTTAEAGSAADGRYLEEIVRAVVRATGGWVVVSFSVGTLSEVADVVVPHVLLRASRWGRVLAAAQSLSGLQPYLDAEGGRVLGDGHVSAIHRPGVDGGRTGWFTVSASGPLLRVDMQNEFLAVAIDGSMACTTPAVIGVLDARTFLPLRADQIRLAADVVVIALPPSLPRRRDAYVERTGPASFGLDFEAVLP